MRSSVLLPLCCVTLIISACSGETDNASNSESNSEAADLTPEGPSLTAQLLGGGKPMPLQVQQQFANGMIIYITAIQAKPTETVLTVKVVNGSERDVELEWTRQKTFLVAQGQKFFLSAPIENPDLKVTKGTTMDGNLVFLGTLPKGGAVTLVINDGQSDGQYSGSPGIGIPLPVTETAWSDDGSKKNYQV